jgi:multidrug efflux pump subunit AcrA (membrane-fusion protein)
VKSRSRVLLIIGIVVVVGVGVLVVRGVVRGNNARAATAAQATAITTVKVARGSLDASITASGQLEPNTIATIRPDSSLPTRKLVKILVKVGQSVKAGQALAEVDPSGLDLNLQSAQANLQSQKVRLQNLQAKPKGLDLAAAEANLGSSRNALDAAQQSYDNTKSLSDQGLASRNSLTDADRALQNAKAAYTSAQLNYENVKAQNADADITAQQASVVSAQSALQTAQLVYDSITIRSPIAGEVAEINVNVGDLISPSTALMTVIDPDPMWLQAQVNENDVVQLKIGQRATIVPSGYPDLSLRGTVIALDLHAATQSNVSVFTATIEVPNRDRTLLWGMNADADITVLSKQNVLTLPVAAVKTSNGASTVTIMDGGQQVSWEVQIGATDGTRTEIVAGLDEGTEVVLSKRSSAASTTTNRNAGGPGFGGVFGILR